MTKEYYSATGEKDKDITELRTRLQEVTSKLETYEKLENELDDVVMQAAQCNIIFVQNVSKFKIILLLKSF